MEKNLQQRLSEFAIQIGTDVKALIAVDNQIKAIIGNKEGTLDGLWPDATLMQAIRWTYDLAATSEIDDSANHENGTVAYSAAKIHALLTALKNDSDLKRKEAIDKLKSDIFGGIPAETLDTIKEIADYILSDQSAMQGLLSSISKRVSVDSVQEFTEAERTQGRANIGAQEALAIGNTNTDLVALYTTAKA